MWTLLLESTNGVTLLLPCNLYFCWLTFENLLIFKFNLRKQLGL